MDWDFAYILSLIISYFILLYCTPKTKWLYPDLSVRSTVVFTLADTDKLGPKGRKLMFVQILYIVCLLSHFLGQCRM